MSGFNSNLTKRSNPSPAEVFLKYHPCYLGGFESSKIDGFNFHVLSVTLGVNVCILIIGSLLLTTTVIVQLFLGEDLIDYYALYLFCLTLKYR